MTMYADNSSITSSLDARDSSTTVFGDMRPTVADIQKRLACFPWNSLEKPGKNKGARGQLLEIALGVPNSSALKDLVDGELKTFTYGESVACTQLHHCLPDIVGELPFEEGKLGKKMEQAIYVAFSRNNDFLGTVTFNKESHPIHYAELQEDYLFICGAIRAAINNKTELGTTTGPNDLLQIRTKASKTNGSYTPLTYNGHQLKNKGMAFYLCGQFGRKLMPK